MLDLLTPTTRSSTSGWRKHYGIPNVYGSQFRRVTLGPELDMRRGLLGKGACSPCRRSRAAPRRCTRGKWFMQTFLGVSPPDPPPNVPTARRSRRTRAAGNARPSMRQQMEVHRRIGPCASCHKIMDPIGFALENFDAIGTWRTEDGGSPDRRDRARSSTARR